MNEEEINKMAEPINKDTFLPLAEKISAWWVLHRGDKISLLIKLKNCCKFVNLDPENLLHASFCLTSMQQAFIGSEQGKEAFIMLQQQAKEIAEDVSVV